MGQNLCAQGPTWWSRRQGLGRLRVSIKGSCKVRTSEERELPWKVGGNMSPWSRLPLMVLTLVDTVKGKVLFIWLHSSRSKRRSLLKEYALNNNNDFQEFRRWSSMKHELRVKFP